MTRLNDPSFIGFDGEPVTGRVPPRLFVYGEMSPKQRGMVAHAYKLFCDAKLVNVGGFLVQNRRLDDGTRVKMMALQGQDHVVVWPSGGPIRLSLPHGFAVVANWDRPRIFKRKTAPTVEWVTDPVQVPQCRADLEGENQVFRANSAMSYFDHPMVLTEDAPRSLWDYLKHSATGATSANPIVPVCTEFGTPANYSTTPCHYAVDNTVVGPEGVLYTTALAPQILSVDPETPVILPAATDAAGTLLALQHTRQAVVAPGITFLRTCNETVRRTDVSSYEMVERHTLTTSIPLDVSIGGSGFSSPDDILTQDGTPEPFGHVHLSMMFTRNNGTGTSQWADAGPPVTGGSGAFVTVGWGFIDADYDLEIGTSTAGSTEVLNPTSLASPEVLNQLIALPAAVGFYWPSITASLNYPTTIFWRGGENHAYILFPGSVSPSYGTEDFIKVRVDTKYDVDALVDFEIELGWKRIKLLEGEGASRMDGKYHTNTEIRGRAIGILPAIEAFTHVLEAYPGGFVTVGSPGALAAWYADLDANNLRAAIIEKLGDFPYPADAIEEVLENTPPVNTGDYAFVSRHVIDYDHKGQFYAAIRVEVTSSGAEWRSGSTYWGEMVLEVEATYTVNIVLETSWVGVGADTVLTTASATRPPFEFPGTPKLNVMHEATGFGTSPGDIVVHTVPQISPPMECWEQLKTITMHQGVNPNIVCADVRTDITGDAAVKAQSTAGIEFSTIENGLITPHTKYVTGQLYARTFKLSDFPDALWLLHSTKCDATENDAGTGPTYFYMPALKTTIDTQDFHIEVRDGVHETWSDDFMPGVSQPADPVDRDIKLYRV